MEELLQVVLKRSASQQQLMLQRVVVQHSEELRTSRERPSKRDVSWAGFLLDVSHLTGRTGLCRHLGLVIFESVSLVHNQAGPLNGAEHSLVNGNQFIGREQDVELDR